MIDTMLLWSEWKPRHVVAIWNQASGVKSWVWAQANLKDGIFMQGEICSFSVWNGLPRGVKNKYSLQNYTFGYVIFYYW